MTHGPSEIFLSAVLICAVYSQTSPEKEIALGQHMAAEIESNHRAIADAEVIGYADSVLNNLSRNESLRLPLKVRVIDNSDLIAALPGGFLILSSGAILRAESE